MALKDASAEAATAREPLRVLFVIHSSTFGGPHNQALRLAGPLRARGWATVVLMPDDPGNGPARLRAADVPTLSVPLGRMRATRDLRTHLRFLRAFPGDVGRIRRVIRDLGIDAVQIGGLVNPQAAFAARLERAPVIWQIIDTRAPRPVALVAMLLLRWLATVVMPTGRRVLDQHPGGRRLTQRVVPFIPPVDTSTFRPMPTARPAVRREWGVPSGAPVVLSVANINPQKGIEHLIGAVAYVRRSHLDVRLVLVGDEYDAHRAYLGRLRALMMRDGLREGADVLFLGARDDIDRQLQGADVLALTSVPRSEGIPTAILEAMSCGVPVVTTDVGGVRDVVDDGETGIIVEGHEPAAIATAVERVLGDAALRERLSSAARRVAEERFAVDGVADAHVQAYELAVAARPRRRPSPRRLALLGVYQRRVRTEGLGGTLRRIGRDPALLLRHIGRIAKGDASARSNPYAPSRSRAVDVELVAALADVDIAAAAATFSELEADRAFLDDLRARYGAVRPDGGARLDLGRFKVLYGVCRLRRPRVVLETGVHDGLSSAVVLHALHRNDHGRLVSIDLPSTDLPPGVEGPGWLVAPALRDRWTLLLGDTRRLLAPTVAECPVDIFLHDSDHSREHRSFEFRTVRPHLAPDGLLLSDDDTDDLLDVLGAEWGMIHRVGGAADSPGDPRIGALMSR